MAHTSSSRSTLLSPALWFSILLAAMCAWILTLPLFPSQDGPMHRYYVHVLDTLLQGKAGYSQYQVRHPIPPYITHYALLLGLAHLFSFDLAEKLFVCLTCILFALGLRLTAKAVGGAGEWAALFFAPLLLSWSMMMGFFNYVLGVALVLLALAAWERMRQGQGMPVFWYLLTLVVLTFTHPISLLLLIAIASGDLVLRFFFRAPGAEAGPWLRQERVRILVLACSFAAMAIPAMAVDHGAKNTATTMADVRFKPEFIRTSILLSGMSPYNSRAHALSINAYRLCLYAIFFAAMYVGGKATLRNLRAHRPNVGATLFFATLVLLVALPIMPNDVNGSFYFSTRLVMVLWPASLLAASAASAPSGRLRPVLIGASVLCALFTLLPAEIYFRPVAQQLARVERIPLPQQQQGLILLGDDLTDYVRFHGQLAFNPFQWGGALPIVRQQDIALDSPWIDQKITPLAPVPGGPLLIADVAATHVSKVNPPLVKGRSLPGSREADMVRSGSFIVYAGTPDELTRGLSEQLSSTEAAKYTCNQPQPWYLICLSQSR